MDRYAGHERGKVEVAFVWSDALLDGVVEAKRAVTAAGRKTALEAEAMAVAVRTIGERCLCRVIKVRKSEVD